MADSIQTFDELDSLAQHLRDQGKKVTLLFAYNGTGKTRLSMAFKELGKQRNADGEVTARDTLYFNAFTEDLFSWDNDLENDSERVLKMNRGSRFFDGLDELEMENRIRPFLFRYADFQFDIDYEKATIRFWRETETNDEGEKAPVPIKVSRGEENIFIWCFFLAIAELAIDGQEAYDWVKYLYIDDPISSLDENNAIAVAVHLAQMLKEQNRLKVVISSHHTLFFNVLCNEMKGASRYFLNHGSAGYQLRDTKDTPRFYHVAMLKELHKAAESGQLFTYHFTILRSIMEKTATFHGFNNVGDIIKVEDDEDGTLKFRYVQLLSHGGYSLFEPQEMMVENKEIFRKLLDDFMERFHFNPEIFPEAETEEVTA
ncbi:MAG: anticodon nuclease [Gammaproteobacteria bacterium]|nr:MAG: anticodon nuclease [Gammaproteobacteria bacterium]